eukprot:12843681-Ditylum_brightwellii.AAC.1
MSPYVLRTIENDNLPHLSNIKCKPELIGAESKAVADAATKMLLYLEIQRGINPMREAEFCNELYRVTPVCTMRLDKYAKRVSEKNGEGMNHRFIGNSWFGSITAVENSKINNCKFIGIVKTRFQLVLERTLDEDKLLGFGYKYNNKITVFICTNDSGQMGSGTPYEARWKDNNNNICPRNIF